MLFLVWMLLTAAIILSFDVLSFSLGRRGWQRFLSTFLLFYSQVVLTEFALGLLTVLSGTTVLIVNLIITASLFFVIQHFYGNSIFNKHLKATLASVRTWLGVARKEPLFLVLLVLGLAQVAWIILLGLLFPVTDFDGNSYHMTYIAQAIQNHHIYDVSSSISWLVGYPKGGELIQMWNVIIPNNDILADLAQVPFLLLGVVSLYALATRVGVSMRDARFASLLFLFLPIVINQAKTTYVDVMLSALFFAALALVTKKNLSRLDLVFTGTIFSLLIAVKATGALFVVACLPFLLLSIITVKKKKIVPDYKKYLISLGLIAAPVIFGLYWYVKNLIAHGTPLYPFGLEVFGTPIFPGRTFQEFIAGAFTNSSFLPNGVFEKVWFVWTEQKDWFGCLYNYDSTFSGLGPLWFTLLVPAALIGIVIAIKRRNYLFLSLTAILGTIFLLYPANFYSRYVIFIVAIGVISFGLASTILGGKMRVLTQLVAIWLALIVIATNFTLCNFSPAVIVDQYHSMRAGHPRESLAYKNTMGDAYIFLQKRMNAGETVVYDSSPYFIYPLWKSDFSNKVIYLPAANNNEWYAKINQSDVKYIFTNVKSKEHGWAENNTRFSSIYKDKLYDVYQVH